MCGVIFLISIDFMIAFSAFGTFVLFLAEISIVFRKPESTIFTSSEYVTANCV